MAATKRMKRALVSVFHKDGLDEILKKLHSEGVSFVSTGGTQSFIESLGLPCDAVEDLTSYPSILGGRVKTLHPKVFGGILARRENENDQKQLAEYEIPEIDLALAARAYAFIKRRGYVIPEDIRAVCHDVMRHRIGLSYEAEANNLTSEEVISEILNKVEVP